jgi:hypothetical protein
VGCTWIAAYGQTEARRGRRIIHDDGVFMLDDRQSITPDQIMEHDRQGELVWASEGARAWVGSKTTEWIARHGPIMAGTETERSEVPATAPDDVAGDQDRAKRLKRVLLVSIGALCGANAILALAVLGVVRL